MKQLINKIIKRLNYDRCYNQHEYVLCDAVFGLCSSCNDKECSYYFDVNKE